MVPPKDATNFSVASASSAAAFLEDATGTLRGVAAGEQVLRHGQPPFRGASDGTRWAADRLSLCRLVPMSTPDRVAPIPSFADPRLNRGPLPLPPRWQGEGLASKSRPSRGQPIGVSR